MSGARIALFLAGLGAVGAALACGENKPPVDPKFAGVAHVHETKCGRCHKPVQPGDKTRAVLEKALAPHRKRVILSEDDWALMVDYLAKPGT